MPVSTVTPSSQATSTWANSVATSVNALEARTSSASVATSQSTTSTSFTDLATVGPTVTMTTGTLVRVTVIATPSAVAGSDDGQMSVAVSGATTITADNVLARGLSMSGGFGNTTPKTASVVLAVTAGSNTFTSKYKGIDGGGGGVTATFANRYVIVERLN